MTDQLFNKIVDNSASDQERLEFYTRIEQDVEAREAFMHFKNIHSLSTFKKEKLLGLTQKSFNHFWRSVHPQPKRNVAQLWFRYAAIVLVTFLVGFSTRFFSSGKQHFVAQHLEYRSEKGSVSQIILSDGSVIWLSTDSRITLDTGTDGEVVAHLSGEAYFDLVPDESRNFVVDLGYFQIKDIGTQFNVRAYSDDVNISTTLLNGKVDLVKNPKESLLTMSPGEHASFDKEKQTLSVTTIDPSLATAWKDGKFVFIDQPLQDICNVLENWYSVKIVIENTKLANTRYTSVVKRSTTINHVLRMLAITDTIKYEIKNRKEGQDIIFIR